MAFVFRIFDSVKQLGVTPRPSAIFRRTAAANLDEARIEHTRFGIGETLDLDRVFPLYLSFGTLTPCGILREAIRQRDSFAAILPDGLINFALESQYGPLSDDRCFSVLLDQITRVEPPSLRLEIGSAPGNREKFTAPKSRGGS